MSDARDRHFYEPNLAETNAVTQHYVPRLLLKAFVGRENRLRVVNAQTGAAWRMSLRRVASRPGWYDLKLPNVRISTEDWLQRIETHAAPLIQRLRSSPTSIRALSAEEEYHLARFLAVLMHRVPKHIDELEASMLSAVNHMIDMAVNYAHNTMPPEVAEVAIKNWTEQPPWEWLGMDEQPDAADHMSYMFGESLGWANLLRVMDWECGFVSPKFPLFSSDNPVARHLRVVRGDFVWGAMTDFDYSIALSPNVLLVIRHANMREGMPRTGTRTARVFDDWQTSWARRVIAADSDKEMYGMGANLTQAAAINDLRRIDLSSAKSANELYGWRPSTYYEAVGTRSEKMRDLGPLFARSA